MTRFFFTIALLGLLLVPTQAEAAYCERWGWRRVCSSDWPSPSCWSQRFCRRWEMEDYRRHDPRPERVYGYERRDWDEDKRICKDVRKAVGDQHLTVDGAKKAASDAWAAAVRFHHGEKFISLDNARDTIFTCSRSSIKEGGVTTLGQTLTRCEISSQPCSPMREREERQ